jgi:hypothetical protein
MPSRTMPNMAVLIGFVMIWGIDAIKPIMGASRSAQAARVGSPGSLPSRSPPERGLCALGAGFLTRRVRLARLLADRTFGPDHEPQSASRTSPPDGNPRPPLGRLSAFRRVEMSLWPQSSHLLGRAAVVVTSHRAERAMGLHGPHVTVICVSAFLAAEVPTWPGAAAAKSA